MKDWWNQFDMAEKFFIELSLLAIKFAAVASLAGCSIAAATPSHRMAEAHVIVASVESKITRPELKDCLKPKTGSTGAVAVAPSKTLLLLTKRGCNPCLRIERQTLPALRKSGWVIEKYSASGAATIWVVDESEHPGVVLKYGVADEHDTYLMPQWILCEGDRVIRRSIGFKTGRQVREFWNLKSCTAVKAVSSEPVQQVRTVHATGGNHWSVEGDFNPSRSEAIEHLQEVHGQSRSRLESMDLESLLRLHDALHEHRTTYRSRPIRKSRTMASACPGGRCP